jgi:hypothetical protein
MRFALMLKEIWDKLRRNSSKELIFCLICLDITYSYLLLFWFRQYLVTLNFEIMDEDFNNLQINEVFMNENKGKNR